MKRILLVVSWLVACFALLARTADEASIAKEGTYTIQSAGSATPRG